MLLGIGALIVILAAGYGGYKYGRSVEAKAAAILNRFKRNLP